MAENPHTSQLGVTGRETVEAVGLGTQQVRVGADLPCWSQTPLSPPTPYVSHTSSQVWQVTANLGFATFPVTKIH